MPHSLKILEIFNAVPNFNALAFSMLYEIFLKTKTFFKKLESRFLVESTKIENTSFP